MTKKRSTKRALALSFISLLLCVSMFVGTTFAWFTDSVSSLNNKIVAGNLDVELEFAKVVDGNITGWETVQGNGEIFDPNALWEPGRVEVVYLKVSNLGTLALKYQLGVNVYGEIIGKTEDGKDIKLSEHLVFKAVEMPNALTTYTDREAVALAAGTEKGLKDYNGKTTALEVGGEDYVALIVYMPETVGNEANYRGDKVPTITLGINLYATQVEAESDSFGKDYDADAWHPDMVVGSASELMTAIINVKDGGTIALSDNLTFDEDSRMSSGGTWYEGLYYVGDKSFTIDLNGNTITNDSKVNDYLFLFKNDGSKANVITFKNGTIEAASSAYCAICTSTSSTQKITINLENVNVIGNNSNGSVIKIRGGAELNVKAGTVVTGKNSYLGVENWAATVNIYDGAEIYQNGTTSYNGCLVGVGGNGTINVYGGYGKGVAGAFIAMTSGGTINVSGGEWIADTDSTFSGNDYALIAQNDKNTYPSAGQSVVNVTGGTFSGGYNCYGNAVGDAQINISAGTFDKDPSAYVAAGYKAVATNGKYVVVADSVDAVVSTPDELKNALTGAAAAGAGDTTIYLAGEIDLGGAAWTPISVDGYHGAGVVTVEGNGATIKGLTAPLFAGGFAGKSGIVIKNLTIADSNIVSTSGLGGGAFIDSADSMHVITLENCHLVNSTVKGERTGGLIGWCTGYAKLNDGPVKAYVTIKNCSVVDSTVHGNGSAGAIAGHPGASDYTYTTIEDCVVKNVKVISDEPVSSWRTGAIVGTANNGHVVINNVTVENVTLTQDGVTATETKLYGRFVPSGTGTLVIDGAEVLANATGTAIKDAFNDGKTNVYLSAGSYDMPGANNSDVAISGTKDTVITVAKPAFHGSNVTFNGVTIKGSGYATGVQHVNTVTYNNATIIGEMCLYGEKVVFNNCTFELNNQYIWTYGAAEVEFNNCTFNTNGKAILVYNEGAGASKVTVKGCTFNATAGAKAGAISNQNCAAIEIDNFQSSGTGVAHVVVTENNTYSSNFSGEWRIKNYVNGNAVTVNGTEYTKTALDGKLMTVTGTVATID